MLYCFLNLTKYDDDDDDDHVRHNSNHALAFTYINRLATPAQPQPGSAVVLLLIVEVSVRVDRSCMGLPLGDDVVDADGHSSASRAMQCHNYLSSPEALVECVDSIGFVLRIVI